MLCVPNAVLRGQTIHATAQCESIKTNVLGITSLQDCNIGVTNYGPTQVVITLPMIMEWFPTLEIENQSRAQAVADKAFNNSKKSRVIAAINWLSPLAVALMGGGIINMSARVAVRAVTATSLANTGAQAFKEYLIGQQPNEAAFLPNLPPSFVLAPFGTVTAGGVATFSAVYTVLGSINYTSGSVTSSVSSRAVASGKASKKLLSRGPMLEWKGDLPQGGSPRSFASEPAGAAAVAAANPIQQTPVQPAPVQQASVNFEPPGGYKHIMLINDGSVRW
jgi:hypothetical protein